MADVGGFEALLVPRSADMEDGGVGHLARLHHVETEAALRLARTRW
jgi:hypothetical protein